MARLASASVRRRSVSCGGQCRELRARARAELLVGQKIFVSVLHSEAITLKITQVRAGRRQLRRENKLRRLPLPRMRANFGFILAYVVRCMRRVRGGAAAWAMPSGSTTMAGTMSRYEQSVGCERTSATQNRDLTDSERTRIFCFSGGSGSDGDSGDARRVELE